MLTFLALGDSYTIGEAVPETGRWPVQLVNKLRQAGVVIADPEIIATTGWTTNELQTAINKQAPPHTYNLVSLLIGVNNQYRGQPVETFQKDFDALLKQAVSFAGGKKERVIVLSIPDYSVTPFSADKNPEKISKELEIFNRAKQEATLNNGLKWFDITPISRNAKQDTTLIAEDELHPSARMYAEWANLIFPYVVNLLRNT